LNRYNLNSRREKKEVAKKSDGDSDHHYISWWAERGEKKGEGRKALWKKGREIPERRGRLQLQFAWTGKRRGREKGETQGNRSAYFKTTPFMSLLEERGKMEEGGGRKKCNQITLPLIKAAILGRKKKRGKEEETLKGGGGGVHPRTTTLFNAGRERGERGGERGRGGDSGGKGSSAFHILLETGKGGRRRGGEDEKKGTWLLSLSVNAPASFKGKRGGKRKKFGGGKADR